MVTEMLAVMVSTSARSAPKERHSRRMLSSTRLTSPPHWSIFWPMSRIRYKYSFARAPRRFGAVTQTRRITGGSYDLQRLEQLNQLSRRICAQHLSLEDTERALDAIMATPQYGFKLQVFTYALVSASFSLFFGGSWLDAAASGVIGVALKCLDRMIRKTEANAFLSALLCSCLGGLLAGLAVRFGLGDNVDMISIGNIMLLIPGVALTNSLRDMFSGNTISGLMRFIEAILLALTIAFGFALAASLV